MLVPEQNIPLKHKTSYRIGGMAKYYIRVHSEKDIIDAFSWAQHRTISCFILGKGSNILISDSGWPGLVIDMSEYTSITWQDTWADCQSGALLHNLVKESVKKNYAGIEELAGIPGSIGGALIMNAGAFQQTISDCLLSVTIYDYLKQKTTILKKNECTFGYRSSSLKRKDSIILSAVFTLRKSENRNLGHKYQEILHRRKVKQPLELPNCGSVFKRPENNYAGALIEACDLKGKQVGGAMVSPKHANFIVNVDNASAEDVRKLIAHIQEIVYDEKKVKLEPEVLFIGDFSTPLYLSSSK